MKKIIAAIIMSAMVLSLVGCNSDNSSDNSGSNNSVVQPTNPSSKSDSTSGKQPESKPDENKNISVSDIYDKLKSAMGEENFLPTAEMNEEYFLNYFNLDKSKIEDYVAYEAAVASVNLDQVIILKCKDGYAEEAVKGFNGGYAQVVSYVRQYPFGVDKVLNARIFTNGNYVAYILAGTPDDGTIPEEKLPEIAKSDYAKIDTAWTELFGSAENKAVVPEDDGQNGGLIPPDDIGDGEIMIGG